MAMMKEIKNLKNLKEVADATKQATPKNRYQLWFDLKNFAVYAWSVEEKKWIPEPPESSKSLRGCYETGARVKMYGIRDAFVHYYEMPSFGSDCQI